jgi:hypothetical protein
MGAQSYEETKLLSTKFIFLEKCKFKIVFSVRNNWTM